MLRSIFDAYRAAFAGLPRTSWILALVTFVNRSGTMVLPFLALYLTRERQMSAQEAGWFISLYGLGGMAGAYLGGWLADRFKPKRVQTFALLGGGVCYVVLGQLRAPWAIGGMLVLAASVMESYRPANYAAVAASCPKERRLRAFGLNRLAANLGVAVGPAVGGFLALRDYRLLFLVDGATCILAGALLAALLELPAARPSSDQGAPTASPWRDPIFLAFLATMFCAALIFFQIDGTFPLYLEHAYGLKEDSVGFVFTLNTLMIVALEMIITKRMEALRPLRVIAFGMVFFAVGFGLLPYGSSLAFVLGTVVVWTVGEMVTMPIMTAFASARAGDDNRGRYMGLYSITFALAFVTAPLLGTAIYEHVGPSAVWHFALMLGGIVAGLALLLDRRIAREQT